ncbi:MAG: GIY-YIG nuclease family protein [Candidatus Liptonbacteria bacterium]|nr:GIY-YIG nuclease family protein [Candidatus Liptonbacteria bacterium]
MPHFVYVLKSGAGGHNYVGCTNNLTKRLRLHNSGGVYSTKNRIPLKLIYSEIFLNQQDAFAREKFLKTGWGKNYLNRVLKRYLKSKKLGG